MRELADRDRVEAKALSAAADQLQSHVDALRRDARSLFRRADHWTELVRKTGAAPHLVNLLRAKGSTDPIDEAARMIEMLPDFVEYHYRHFQKHIEESSRRQRDRNIVSLSRKHTNKEIKAMTGLSVRQIQRILKASDLGQYAKKRNPVKRKPC